MRTVDPQDNSDDELGYASAEDSNSTHTASHSSSKIRKRVLSNESIATINYDDLKKRLKAALLQSKLNKELERDAKNALLFLDTLNPTTSDFDKKRLLTLNKQLYREKIIPKRLTWQNNEGQTWEDFANRALKTGATFCVAKASDIIRYSGSLLTGNRAQTPAALETKLLDDNSPSPEINPGR